MPDACKLWVSLASDGRHHEPGNDPQTYLLFKRTGFLVGLLDEPGTVILDEETPVKVHMRRADAEGLGLGPEDFAEGVAICRDADEQSGVGWRCDPAQLLIGAGERPVGWGQNTPHLVATAHVSDGVASTPRPAPPEPAPRHRRWRRMVVRLNPAGDNEALLHGARQFAIEHRTSVVLAGVGELPETGAHAAQLRASLGRLLRRARQQLPDIPIREVVRSAGNPVRSLLEIVDDEAADLLVVGVHRRTLSRPLDADELIGGFLRPEGIALLLLPAERGSTGELDLPASRPGQDSGTRALQATLEGKPPGHGPGAVRHWAQLREELRSGVYRTFRAEDMTLVDIEATWFLGSPSRGLGAGRFRLQPIIDGLADAGHWRDEPLRHVRSILCTVEPTADEEERLEVEVRPV